MVDIAQFVRNLSYSDLLECKSLIEDQILAVRRKEGIVSVTANVDQFVSMPIPYCDTSDQATLLQEVNSLGLTNH